MPDIQTALKNALSKTLVEWDDDDAPPLPSVQPMSTSVNSVSAPSQNATEKPMPKNLFPIRNNVTRETFNYIKQNPGSKRKEIIKALDHMGFKEASTSSIMSQLCRNKQAHITNGLYYVDVPEYIPIKNYKAIAKQAEIKAAEVKVKRKYEKKASAGIGALLEAKIKAPNTHMEEAVQILQGIGGVEPKRTALIVRSQTPHDIVKNLTVYQARELYVHLKEIFGG